MAEYKMTAAYWGLAPNLLFAFKGKGLWSKLKVEQYEQEESYNDFFMLVSTLGDSSLRVCSRQIRYPSKNAQNARKQICI